jgi:hypothetical protein
MQPDLVVNNDDECIPPIILPLDDAIWQRRAFAFSLDDIAFFILYITGLALVACVIFKIGRDIGYDEGLKKITAQEAMVKKLVKWRATAPKELFSLGQ